METNSEDTLIVRDFLARQRTKLANDRTLLAYIRTSLYFLVSATALVKVDELDNIKGLGYLSFFISGILLLVGALSYIKVHKRLKKGDYLDM